MTATITCFGPRDWRIRYQGASTAYWFFSRSFATRREARTALEAVA